MATEGPFMGDGAQTVAAANYWNPTSKLYGYNGSGQFLGVKISASRTVALQTAAGGPIYGVLQNSPDIGQAADVILFGISKVVAGAAISFSGNPIPLMVDANGRFVPWTAGAGNSQVGEAIEACSAADAIVTAKIYAQPVKVLT